MAAAKWTALCLPRRPDSPERVRSLLTLALDAGYTHGDLSACADLVQFGPMAWSDPDRLMDTWRRSPGIREAFQANLPEIVELVEKRTGKASRTKRKGG